MSDALAAALMMQQRSQPRFDPAENSRRFGQMLMQQGASTAPVQSPLEGLARALTGGVGGLFEGMAERDQQAKNRKLIEGLTGAMAETDPKKRMEILKGVGADDNSGVLAPFLGSMLAQQYADERKYSIQDRNLDAAGVGRAGAPSAQPGLGGGQQGPLTIDIKPLPNATVSPSGFNNNTGNIRAGVGFPGEGPPQNGFATFATPQQGVNAMVQNLGAYLKQNPNMTVAQAIAQWAPPTENNTQQYISQVAEGTGINPGMPLGEVMKDPAVAAQLLDAMTRKEKGGLPQGVTADTFMAATGGQPQAPQTQVAQGGEFQPTNTPAQSVPGALPQTQAAPQPQPQATAMPETSPAAQQLMQQAQQARAGGDRERALALAQKAQEAQAAYVQERAKTADTRSFDQADWDRKNAIENAQKPPSEFQSRSATYADRMIQHGATLDAYESQGANQKGRMLDTTVMGVGIPGANYAQSPQYQKFKAAKDNWIAANLRQESGAAIGAKEYADADQQYFPQPGDSPDLIASKRELRKTAAEAMARSAGDKYKPDIEGLRSRAKAPVRVSTPEEARKLPSGTPIMLPDGSEGVVP